MAHIYLGVVVVGFMTYMQQSLNRALQHLSLNFLEHPKKSHVQSAADNDVRLIYCNGLGCKLTNISCGSSIESKEFCWHLLPVAF